MKLSQRRPQVVVLDYGSGNLRSAERALARAGADVAVTADRDAALAADGLVVPGVGAFAACMAGLRAVEGERVIDRRLAGGRPVLGICVGMQILFSESVEFGRVRGLDILKGRIVRFDPATLDGGKVPHMGWNEVEPRQDSKLLRNVAPRPYLYFAHSYYAPLHAATAATCNYMLDYTAALESNNIYGVQFHPEKSGALGLQIVRNFVEL